MLKSFKTSSTEETREFYEGLTKGEEKRGIWGRESRFDPTAIAAKDSVQRHFAGVVANHLGSDHDCLDLGCGPGGFLSLLAPLCRSVIGADIVPSFIEDCRRVISDRGLDNASALLIEGSQLPFQDGQFDRVVMVDTIHHLEHCEQTIDEVFRVLKVGGQFLIFEPNKLNPVLAMMCALDPNEHGLLRMGTFAAYRRMLGNRFTILEEQFNGLLVGPEGKLSVAVADYVSGKGKALLGWFSPKVFIVARKS